MLLLALMMTAMSVISVAASQATSFTYTLDDEQKYVRTQDAYLPDRTITNLGLVNPNDILFDDNNNMYIADTGNKRIVIYNIDSEKVVKILDDATVKKQNPAFPGFSSPKGLFRSHDGDLYVADAEAMAVYRFSANLVFKKKYAKPTAVIFADTNYKPTKVAVDTGNNLYVVSEGVYAGIIQMAETGEFLGYFASNKTKLTPQQRFLKLIYNKEQQKNSELLNTTPPPFENIYVDKDGTAYSVSTGDGTDMLKKHSTKGTNMYTGDVISTQSMTDVTTDSDGIIYTSDKEGYITAYTTAGELIFQLGAKVDNVSISGLFQNLTTIAIDNKNNIWTADGETSYLQSFRPTEYANTIFKALKEYENGEYTEALGDWNYVLRLNQMSVLAHNGVAKAYYNNEEYKKAMKDYEIAGNREGYSLAFWEVRNKIIQKYIGPFLVAVVCLILLKLVVGLIDKKKRIKRFRRKMVQRILRLPIIGEIGYAFRCARHPIERYYEIRVGRHGSVISATIIYIIFFAVYMWYQTGKGFIYQYTDVEDMDIGAIVVGFFAILILFIICNFLVTSITDGDGTLKQVYMIPAYGLMPLMFAMIATIVCSYGLTYNESFILTVIMVIGTVWTIATIFNGLSTIHDYDFSGTVLSLIITFIFMLISAIVVLIIIILSDQLFSFITTVGKEIIRNVTGQA